MHVFTRTFPKTMHVIILLATQTRKKKMWADRGDKKLFPEWNQFVDAIFF